MRYVIAGEARHVIASEARRSIPGLTSTDERNSPRSEMSFPRRRESIPDPFFQQETPAIVSESGRRAVIAENYFFFLARSRRSQSYQASMPSPVVAERAKISMSLLMERAKPLARFTSKLT